MPADYGTRDNVFKCYNRWFEAGAWEGLLAAVGLDAGLQESFIDSTLVDRTHKMSTEPKSKPVMFPTPGVLFIGGHDPTGGAGIQADIETAAMHHCRAYSLVTCLSAQDSCNVRQIYPQDSQAFYQQAETLLNDVTPDWIKIGLIGDSGIAEQIVRLLNDLAKPVVFDPVLAAGGGYGLANQPLVDVVLQDLLPHVFLLTPNRAELRRLGGRQDTQSAIAKMFAQGCQHVLLTSADESEGDQVANRLYSQSGGCQYSTWPKLPYTYHGSGCTLASACACRLAQGLDVKNAVQEAQQFTWQSLELADKTGQGQHLPARSVD